MSARSGFDYLYVICGFAVVGISCLLYYIGERLLEGSALFPALNPIEKSALGASIPRPAVFVIVLVFSACSGFSAQ